MLRHLLGFLLLCQMAQAQASETAAYKFVMNHPVNTKITAKEYQLPNGLTVFLTKNPSAPNVAVHHWVRAGSLHEKPGSTGIAHLFEHMMFRPLRAGEATFFEKATKLGASVNANTRFESTFYDSRVPLKQLSKLLVLESDRFKHLVVSKDLLDVERKAVWSEYSTKFDANPMIDLWFQIYQKAFPNHPYGWTIIGFREDLEKITAEDCNAFFKKFYVPSNTGLFITGDINPDDLIKEVAQLYGDWKSAEPSKLPAPFTAETKEVVAEGKLPSKARFTLWGMRVPNRDKTNIREQALANYIFFHEANGLVKRRLVDREHLAAEVSDWNFDYDNGMMSAGIVLLPETKLDRIREQLPMILEDFKKLPEAEFNIFKKNLHIAVSEGLQRNVSLGSSLALQWGKHGDVDLTAEIAAGPLKTGKEDVLKFLEKYFKRENFVFVAHKDQLGGAK